MLAATRPAPAMIRPVGPPDRSRRCAAALPRTFSTRSRRRFRLPLLSMTTSAYGSRTTHSRYPRNGDRPAGSRERMRVWAPCTAGSAAIVTRGFPLLNFPAAGRCACRAPRSNTVSGVSSTAMPQPRSPWCATPAAPARSGDTNRSGARLADRDVRRRRPAASRRRRCLAAHPGGRPDRVPAPAYDAAASDRIEVGSYTLPDVGGILQHHNVPAGPSEVGLVTVHTAFLLDICSLTFRRFLPHCDIVDYSPFDSFNRSSFRRSLIEKSEETVCCFRSHHQPTRPLRRGARRVRLVAVGERAFGWRTGEVMEPAAPR